MIISVINHSALDDSTVLETIRVINRQITEDFYPYWSLAATLRLEGKSEKKPTAASNADMRGDAVLYLWDEVDVDEKAKKRGEIKAQARTARRGIRYQQPHIVSAPRRVAKAAKAGRT